MELEQDPAPSVAVDRVTGLPLPARRRLPSLVRSPSPAKRKRVVADNIAPEDILFTPTAAPNQDKGLVSWGFPASGSRRPTWSRWALGQDEVDELRSDRDLSPEEAQRNDGAILNEGPSAATLGDSERPLWLVVAYVRADNDGDGVSELLRVVYAHAWRHGRVASSSASNGMGWPSIALASPIPDEPHHRRPIAVRPRRRTCSRSARS